MTVWLYGWMRCTVRCRPARTSLNGLGGHALRERVAAQVVFHRAELLRHRLRGAAADAAQLRFQVRDLEQDPGVVGIATSPVTLVVATAASSLHAAVHAMSPASSGLCRGEQFATTVDISVCASRRFMRVARGALLDAPDSYASPNWEWAIRFLRPVMTDSTCAWCPTRT